MTPRQEAVLDLAMEQLFAPAMARVSASLVALMAEAGIPLEAVMTELMHRYDGLDVAAVTREALSEIESGKFDDEWEAERDAGYPNLRPLRAEKLRPEVFAFEKDLRERLGERASGT